MICILASLFVWAQVSTPSFAASRKKPNILILLADDLAWNDVGCYGNKEIRTPNIDAFTKEGMKFNLAFTATAMCSPTRQQLYTGLFPVRNGAYPNHSRVKPGTKSIVHHMRDMDYRVALVGKGHIGPQQSFPFDRPKDALKYFSDKSSPFCMIFASHHPHPKWPKIDGYDPAKITVPSFMVDNPETRQALCRYYTAVTKFDTEVGEYLAMLKRAGVADNTIVIVTSEQGPDFPFGKWTCYDYGLRTSFMVRWPGVVKPGSETDAMIQYVDVVPTLIEAAGRNPDKFETGRKGAPGTFGERFDGRSFLSVLRGKATEHNELVYGIHTTKGIIAGQPYPVRSVRDRRYKLILNLAPDTTFQNIVTEKNYEGYWDSWVRDAPTDKRAAALTKRYQHRPAVEFFDVVNDPFEEKNLANQAEQKDRIQQMRKSLHAWMAQQGDLGMKTELAKKPGKR